jgi:NAD(P)H-hydrate epimerase
MGVISENAFSVIKDELGNYQCIIVGPGFGLDETTKEFLCRLFGTVERGQKSQIGFVLKESEEVEEEFILPACVIDADGLKLLAKIENWWKLLPEETILTPHPGEMSVMTGESLATIQQNRMETARKWAETWKQVVVLKGAFTVIANPSGDVSVIPIAHPALARAGTGDVLTGAIAGFRAQGVSAYEAAILGCYIHAKAGEFAADMLGTSGSVLAGDVADAIALVLSDLESF